MVNDFRSDREVGKRPFSREKAYPELQDGMSFFGSLEAARERWLEMAQIAEQRQQEVKAGYYIAAVPVGPDHPFDVEDLGEVDEHLTVWGDAEALAAAVVAVYPARS